MQRRGERHGLGGVGVVELQERGVQRGVGQDQVVAGRGLLLDLLAILLVTGEREVFPRPRGHRG